MFRDVMEGGRVGELTTPESFKRNWGWLLALGVIWIVLGAIAVIAPFAATLATELLLGALFLVGGLAQVIQAFRCRDWPGILLHALGGMLAVVLGGVLVIFPLQGMLTLTLALSAFFIVAGGLKILYALNQRPLRRWGWILFSGVLGVVVGALIWMQWPGSAAWVLGILVGVELIVTGWWMVLVALAARRA